MRKPPVLAVNEKFTAPPETLPIVSQAWSLAGAKLPVSGAVAGTTATAPPPAATPSPREPPGTNARGSSSTELPPVSAMYTLPEPSTATPAGPFSPEETRVLICCVAAFHSLMALSPVSAI